MLARGSISSPVVLVDGLTVRPDSVLIPRGSASGTPYPEEPCASIPIPEIPPIPDGSSFSFEGINFGSPEPSLPIDRGDDGAAAVGPRPFGRPVNSSVKKSLMFPLYPDFTLSAY